MTTKKSNGRTIIIVLVLVVAALAAYGYSRQAATMKRTTGQETGAAAAPVDTALLAPRPSDIILGDMNAMVTIVEYSSLTCPHCAHFYNDVLPTLEKDYIDTGKVKMVMRHFPLNEPAVKAAEVVECAGTQGNRRATFLKVLFETQEKWAFSDNYLKDLKPIALVGGIDSAAFDSCTSDPDLEAKILNSRKEAADKLHVDATPTFFINGKKLGGDYSIDNFRDAINAAMPK